MYHIDKKAFRKAMIDADFRTDEDLARQAGISSATLRNMLLRDMTPTIKTLEKIGTALNLSSEDMGRIFLCK